MVDTTKGYNPTFDLWSTAGLTTTPPGPAGHDHSAVDQKLVGRDRRARESRSGGLQSAVNVGDLEDALPSDVEN